MGAVLPHDPMLPIKGVGKRTKYPYEPMRKLKCSMCGSMEGFTIGEVVLCTRCVSLHRADGDGCVSLH